MLYGLEQHRVKVSERISLMFFLPIISFSNASENNGKEKKQKFLHSVEVNWTIRLETTDW